MLGSVRGVVSNDHSYRDKANPRVPTLFRARKATRFGRTIARSERPGVVEEPGMCRRSLRGNREISRSAVPDGRVRAAKIGGSKLLRPQALAALAGCDPSEVF